MFGASLDSFEGESVILCTHILNLKNMLEFIIALMMSLGLYSGDMENVKLDAASIDIIKADAAYTEYGGDQAFDDLKKSSNSQDQIVIGIDPNPNEED